MAEAIGALPLTMYEGLELYRLVEREIRDNHVEWWEGKGDGEPKPSDSDDISCEECGDIWPCTLTDVLKKLEVYRL